jgi:Trypsin-co-occurring domain 1
MQPLSQHSGVYELLLCRRFVIAARRAQCSERVPVLAVGEGLASYDYPDREGVDTMTRLIRVPLEDGTSVVVEEADPGGVVRAGKPGQIAADAERTLESSLDSVTRAGAAVITKLREAGQGFEAIDVELGIKLAAQAGVVIASASTEANFKVTLHWRRMQAGESQAGS